MRGLGDGEEVWGEGHGLEARATRWGRGKRKHRSGERCHRIRRSGAPAAAGGSDGHPMCLMTASANSEHLTFLTVVSPSAFMRRSKS